MFFYKSARNARKKVHAVHAKIQKPENLDFFKIAKTVPVVLKKNMWDNFIKWCHNAPKMLEPYLNSFWGAQIRTLSFKW